MGILGRTEFLRWNFCYFFKLKQQKILIECPHQKCLLSFFFFNIDLKRIDFFFIITTLEMQKSQY